MATLSKQYAKVSFTDGVEIDPISVQVTLDEAWAPYVQATVVLPSNSISGFVAPTFGSRVKLRLQQDNQNLLYVYEMTENYGGWVAAVTAAFTPCLIASFTREYAATWNIFTTGAPISKITTEYTPVTPLKLTNDGLSTVWRMTAFLQVPSEELEPYTSFTADLGLRSISYDYISKEATLTLASDEALAQDVYGFGSPTVVLEEYTARATINIILNALGAILEPGTAIGFTSGITSFKIPLYRDNVGTTPWDFIVSLANIFNFKIYCDELRRWYLVQDTTVSGNLELKDNDNITDFQKIISRENPWYNEAIIEYEDPSGTKTIDAYRAPMVGPTKTLYIKKDNTFFPGTGGAQALVERAVTRGETYSVEAINNFNARPRQELIVDITGEPVKTGIVQSITWSLPSARMSVDIRNLEEVI
jgi:hypothetical protein